MPGIVALRYNQPVTVVNDGETLDVECSVERVYPVDGLEFQLMSGATEVSSRQSGDSTGTNSDGTFSVKTAFSSQNFLRSYSSTEAGLTCKVYHQPDGDHQSDRLTGVTVRCK